jgi:hypothetical protein
MVAALLTIVTLAWAAGAAGAEDVFGPEQAPKTPTASSATATVGGRRS